MSYPLIESTLEFKAGNRTFRLWLKETDLREDYNLELLYKDLYPKLNNDNLTNRQAVECIVNNAPNLTAIQIKRIGLSRDLGIVIYMVDF